MNTQLTTSILTSLKELAFVAETVAHLRGMEADILPKTDRARALIAQLEAIEPQGGDVTALNLFQRTHAGFVQVTALFADSAAANAYMAEHEDQSLLALGHGIALLANKDDMGVPEAAVPTPAASVPTVAVQFPISAELVDALLCGTIETGYEWFLWSDSVTEPDPDLPGIPRYVSAMCAEWDCDEGEAIGEPVLVDAARIATGITKILSGEIQISATTVAALQRALADADTMDIDADEADAIMQAVVFGELRYG